MPTLGKPIARTPASSTPASAPAPLPTDTTIPAPTTLLHIVVVRDHASGHVEERALTLPSPATIADALTGAGWLAADKTQPVPACGIWGRVRPINHPLHDGDRVELYRSLKADPKQARRERFLQQGARNAGLFARRRPNSKAGY